MALKRVWWWVRARWDRDRVAMEVDDDIRTHLELDAERMRAEGVDPRVALRRARERFGDPDRWRRDMLRAASAVAWPSARPGPGRLVLHARQGARSFLRTPGSSLLVALTLAAAVGANTAMIEVTRQVLSGAGGVVGAESVVSIHAHYEGLPEGLQQQPVHPVGFRRITGVDGLLRAAAFKAGHFNLTGRGRPRRLDGMLTTPDLFDVAGVRPALGQGFLDTRRGDERVVVLSWDLWSDLFGGDPEVLGSSIVLNDAPYEVVGVTPPDFRFPRGDDVPATFRFPPRPDLWVPYDLPDAGPSDLGVVARVRPGVSSEAVQSQLDALSQALDDEHPSGSMSPRFRALDMQAQAVDPVRPALRIVMVGTGLLLLVAVGNVLALGIARGETRTRELSVRMALGAGRRGAVAFVMMEAAALAAVVGVMGLAVAAALLAGLRALALGALPGMAEVTPSWWSVPVALAFALLGSGALTVGPVLRIRKGRLSEALRGARTAGSRRTRRQGRIVVATDLALTMILMSTGLTLAGGVLTLLEVDPGFDAATVLTAEVTLPEEVYPDQNRAQAVQRAQPQVSDPAVPRFQRALAARLRQQPGIVDAAFAHPLPFAGTQEASVYWIEGMDPPAAPPLAEYTVVSEGYFTTMGIPLLDGREFSGLEAYDSEPVAMVSQSLASLFPGGRAVGSRIKLGGRADSPYPWLRVVGVVPEVRRTDLTQPGRPELYVHAAQGGYTSMATTRLVVRVAEGLSPSTAASTVRSVLSEMDPSLPLEAVAPMASLLGDSLARPRFAATLLMGFALLALLITGLGLYAVVSYAVSTRARELAVRTALGAAPGRVLGSVLKETLGAVLAGLAAGALGAALALHLTEGIVARAPGLEASVLAAAALVLLLAAALAATRPARRCLKQDPVRALAAD